MDIGEVYSIFSPNLRARDGPRSVERARDRSPWRAPDGDLQGVPPYVRYGGQITAPFVLIKSSAASICLSGRPPFKFPRPVFRIRLTASDARRARSQVEMR